MDMHSIRDSATTMESSAMRWVDEAVASTYSAAGNRNMQEAAAGVVVAAAAGAAILTRGHLQGLGRTLKLGERLFRSGASIVEKGAAEFESADNNMTAGAHAIEKALPELPTTEKPGAETAFQYIARLAEEELPGSHHIEMVATREGKLVGSVPKEVADLSAAAARLTGPERDAEISRVAVTLPKVTPKWGDARNFVDYKFDQPVFVRGFPGMGLTRGLQISNFDTFEAVTATNPTGLEANSIVKHIPGLQTDPTELTRFRTFGKMDDVSNWILRFNPKAPVTIRTMQRGIDLGDKRGVPAPGVPFEVTREGSVSEISYSNSGVTYENYHGPLFRTNDNPLFVDGRPVTPKSVGLNANGILARLYSVEGVSAISWW
jgi:hypothetical protein